MVAAGGARGCLMGRVISAARQGSTFKTFKNIETKPNSI
jgi:hypothetical protein